jgi:Zn-finger nucleic acid-binding protein
MLCNTCKEDVSSKFAHALSVNICPMCGGSIIDEKLKSILNDLKIIMEDAKNYPEQVADWLFSNYQFKKFDPNEAPIQFNSSGTTPAHRSPITVSRSAEDVLKPEKMVPTSVFQTRAGTNKIKRAVDIIRGGSSGGAAPMSEFIGTDPEYADEPAFDDSGIAPLDGKGANDLQNIFSNPPSSQDMEIQRLKKLRASAGGGTFRRD